MMVPLELEERVRAMVAEIGYRKAAWFCRDKRSGIGVGERTVLRFVQGKTSPFPGTIVLIERGVAAWERARPRVDAVSSGTVYPLSSRN